MLKIHWHDRKRSAQLVVIKKSKPLREWVLMATREAVKCLITADPDMWPGCRDWIHHIVDDLWHDITEEVEARIFEARCGVEGHETHNVQSLSEMGVRPTCLSPRWFRAFILYHFLPFDKAFFGCLRDPAFWVFTILSIVPGLRVLFFALLLILLICPGRPDEFQLVQYIMMFKGTQFLSSGIFMALYGGILYYNCVHQNGIHTCHEGGPGTSKSAWLAIVDMVGCSLLVWLGFFILPWTQKAAGLKALNISSGSADAEGMGMGTSEDDATQVINAAAEAAKAPNAGPTRTLMASSRDGTRVELKVQDDMSGRHKWLITPVGEGLFQIQLLGGVRGGQILTHSNQCVSLNFQDASDCQHWELTKVEDVFDNLYHIRTPARLDQEQTFLGVQDRCGKALGLHAVDDGSGRHRWQIPGLDVEAQKQAWKVFGYRRHHSRGGRLRGLLVYDVCCFLACVGILVALTVCEVNYESHVDVMSLPCAQDNTAPAKQREVQELVKRAFQLKGMHFRAALYWANVVYSLLAVPFTFFNIPVLQAILTHTKATGFNQRGVAVAYLLPPCPEELPPSAAELLRGNDDLSP